MGKLRTYLAEHEFLWATTNFNLQLERSFADVEPLDLPSRDEVLKLVNADKIPLLQRDEFSTKILDAVERLTNLPRELAETFLRQEPSDEVLMRKTFWAAVERFGIGDASAVRIAAMTTWNLIKMKECVDAGGRFHRNFIKFQCMYCAKSACMLGCPEGAISQKDSGAVVIDEDKCVGCGYCRTNCPFNVPRIDPERNMREDVAISAQIFRGDFYCDLDFRSTVRPRRLHDAVQASCKFRARRFNFLAEVPAHADWH